MASPDASVGGVVSLLPVVSTLASIVASKLEAGEWLVNH